MLTPLLLDSSSNGYVDTWLQVTRERGRGAEPPSACAKVTYVTNYNLATSTVARTS